MYTLWKTALLLKNVDVWNRSWIHFDTRWPFYKNGAAKRNETCPMSIDMHIKWSPPPERKKENNGQRGSFNTQSFSFFFFRRRRLSRLQQRCCRNFILSPCIYWKMVEELEQCALYRFRPLFNGSCCKMTSRWTLYILYRTDEGLSCWPKARWPIGGYVHASSYINGDRHRTFF